MRFGKLTIVAMGVLALSACGPAQAVVTAELQVDNADGGTETRALGNLEIQLLPYDRDAIFDSLVAAFGRPEPPIPDSLLEARDRVAESQQAWGRATDRWNTLRDSLQTISSAMDRLNRGESRYRVLFNEFNALEREYGRVEGQMNQAFQAFEDLQGGIIAQSDEVRLHRENWADEAFAEVGVAISLKLREVGLDEVFDTTDASGVVSIEASPGQYWVHARHELPYTELYWNQPITLVRGEPVQIILSRANASVRPKL